MHAPAPKPCFLFVLSLLAAMMVGCPTPRIDAGPSPLAGDAGLGTTDAGATAPSDCNDDDPLTWKHWAGFCDDRIDDNCTLDDPQDPCPFNVSVHNYCNTSDEPCPATLPGSSPPRFNCSGAPPRNVIAWATLANPTPEIERLCVYIYESSAVEGEHLLAVDFENGVAPTGPDSLCSADFLYRHYLFLSDLDDGECPPVTVNFPSTGDDYRISNRCRKAMRPLEFSDPLFDPDVQFFAFSTEEARAKLAILESIEVACLRAINSDGDEVRPWASQLVLPLTMVEP